MAPNSLYIQSHHTPRDFEDFPMVSSLIDPRTKWWKINAIRALILPFEADTILKIPLSQNLVEDKLIWLGNKRGVFSVKSAYFIAAKILEKKDRGESSSGDPNTQLWKNLWKLKLPAKIKIFAWRACVNGLPVFVNMVEKGIHFGYDCPVCGEEPESLLHALISCDFALSVWSLWQDCPMHLLLNMKDFAGLVHQFCSSSNVAQLEPFFAISWYIWYNRNLLAHNEDGLPPLQIWEMARSIVEDYQEAISVNLIAEQQPNGGWEAPSFFKVNVDGASSLDGLGSGGTTYRVVAALSKALPLHYPAAWTELFAMEQGVILAQEMTLSKVIFESDAILVIQAISQDLWQRNKPFGSKDSTCKIIVLKLLLSPHEKGLQQGSP
ncbi:uncharacterized protein LOC142616185 [Castanea sativa]|uniref:uncharacterized protein LOC142616185 n=1 Tax=Castanea sativa TaxID=21020 RepID=UPI003F64A0C9